MDKHINLLLNEGALQKMITIESLIDRGRITSIDDLRKYLKQAIKDEREQQIERIIEDIEQEGQYEELR